MSNRYKSSFTGIQMDTSVNKVINVGYNSDEITNNVSASGVTGAKVSNALATLKTTVDNAVSSGSANSAIAVFPINASGSVNAYIGNFSGQNLFTDMIILLTINVTNTGASTFNYGNTGNKKIQKFNGANTKIDVEPRELQQNRPYYLKYDGTDFILVNAKDVATYSAEQTETVEVASLPNTAVEGEVDAVVKGQTIVNLLGTKGDCEDETDFTGTDATLATSTTSDAIVTGTKALEITLTSTSGTADLDIFSKLTTGKYYLATAYIKRGNATNIKLSFQSDDQTVDGSTITTTSYTRVGVVVQPTDYDTATGANIRITVTGASANVAQVDAIQFNEITQTEYTAGVTQALLDKYPYVNDIKHVEANRVKVVGKNLFDLNSGIKVVGGPNGSYNGTTIPNELQVTNISFSTNSVTFNADGGSNRGIVFKQRISVKPNTTYRFVRQRTGSSDFSHIFYFDKNSLIGNTVANPTTFLTPTNCTDIEVYLATYQGTVTYSNVMIIENVHSTTYEPYTETTRYFDKSLKSLPNGTKDTIDNGGLYTKRISDEYVLNSDDITGLDVSGTNVDIVQISYSRFLGLIVGVDLIGAKMFTTISTPRNGFSPRDSIENSWKHYFDTAFFGIIVPKGTYADLTAAKTALAGTKLYYELATPTTEQLPFQPLQSQASGTIYNEPITRELLTYATGLTLTNDLRKADKNFIESLYKVDGEKKTPIALASVTATNSKLITITGATNYDTYEIVYETELGNSTRAELSYKYPLNQVAQLDDVSKVAYNTSKEFTSHKSVTQKFMDSLKIEGDDLSYYNGEEWINVSGQKIYGLEWDSTTDTYVRLGNAKGKIAQAYSPNNTTPTNDFNSIFPWSNIRRCNLADDGTVNAYYGDVGYVEDGSNGQVMVEIPKFYYKREWDGVKRRWYVSDKEFDGYALLANGTSVHPAFIRNGDVQDNIYVSAYEGCAYDVSATDYVTDDAQTVDFTASTGDLLSSISGVKPISGLTQDLTIGKSRIIAKNRGTSWQLLDFWSASAVQLLLLIEYGTFNSQLLIGKGVVDKASGTVNESENTGATTTLGNGSGYLGTNGLSSVTYRGIENFWGNIWFWVDGINIKADRQPWVADYNFASDTFSGVYTDTGLTLPSSDNYVRNLHDFDGYLPSEVVSGSGSTFVTDFYFQNTGNRVALLGGSWFLDLLAGAWCWHFALGSSIRSRDVSARLAFLPNT